MSIRRRFPSRFGRRVRGPGTQPRVPWRGGRPEHPGLLPRRFLRSRRRGLAPLRAPATRGLATSVSEEATAPDFELAADGGDHVKLSDHRRKFVVLYFYPKDDTLANN
jgi:hypothetical protein